MDDIVYISKNGYRTVSNAPQSTRYYSERYVRKLCKENGIPFNESVRVKIVSKDKILNAVAEVFGVGVDDIVKRTRKYPVPDARCAAVNMLLTHGHSTAAAAAVLKRDRATMFWHIKRHSDLMETDKGYRGMYEKIEHLSQKKKKNK